MNRFFLNIDQFEDDQVIFPADIAHQIIHVLRLVEGDGVEVLDNSGIAYHVILMQTKNIDRLVGQITAKSRVTSEPSVQVSLYFGLTHRDKVEWILQKGTEIGLAAFCPFISSRTQVTTTALSDQKIARWKRIIREAAEQSGRGQLPELLQPKALADWYEDILASGGFFLTAWEEADPATQTIPWCLERFSGHSMGLLIGPEGGFSEDEIQQAISAGCQIVSLGQRILRMETAAIVFSALVMHELGQL